MEDYQSESINELAAALAKAQGEMEHAKKDQVNPFFSSAQKKASYADLPAIMDAARPHLAKNGLAVTQITRIDDTGKMTLVTQICHSSGQWLRCWYPVNPVKNDPQGMGSALTYARRYAYSSIIGVAAAGEDDDGNAASGNASKDIEVKSVFKNAGMRKTFCDNVIKSFDDAQTTEDLKTLFALNGERIQEMKDSGNEHDAMAVDELRKRYAVAMQRFTKPHIEDEVDEFKDGGRVGINY